MTTDYEAFLREKFDFHRDYGFDVDPADLSPCLLPHQRDVVTWALKGGRRALFEAFGLGKSVQQLEILRLIHQREQGRCLIVCPLGVKQEFHRDAHDLLDLEPSFIRRDAELGADGLYVTNYESIRDGRLNPDLFDAVSLDEASVLRSFGSKTYQSFLGLFCDTKYRFVATATPSPNRYKELIHYAGFLGVMDTGQALTRFFQRDSTQANNLTLYPHKTVEFHVWLHSWAIFLQKPSDLCRCECHVSTLTLKASGSGASSPSNGGPAPAGEAPGSANATAATHGLLPPTTSATEGPVAAGASAPGTVARGLPPTESGERSSGGAPISTTRTGPTTADEESPSATGGGPSPTSSPTWANSRPEPPSSASTTTPDTAPTIADGPLGKSRPTTPGALSPSATTAEPSLSLSGPKNSASAIQRSTVESSPSAGPSKGHSRTWCDECRCDEGYDLPELDVRWHELPAQPGEGIPDRDGQGRIFRDSALGVTAAAREKRDTLPARVAAAAAIVAESPDDHFILWHDLESERHALKAAMPEVVEVYGSLDLDTREERIIGFSDGDFRLLATKPIISGSGCNFQRFCHREIFVGVGFKFADFVQAVHRCYRYLQPHQVRIDIIYAESEREVVKTLRRKWAQHEELTAQMSKIIKEHGLDQVSISKALERALGVERVEITGEGWTLANNDCVDETRAMADASVDEIVTSIPFAFQYEYTPSYNDFGHTDSNEHFWAQMDFLTPELLRVLRPGRIYACHTKDRINFGNVTGAGYSTVSPFHAEAIMHNITHGFEYMGMITVVTDVVRENNQSYRLGWTEQAKDGTKMGVGSPEYVLLFRKPQTDRGRGYADVPVVKSKDDYSRARWQVDAHAFWRSNGNRPLTAEDMRGLATGQRMRLFEQWTLNHVYDHELHIAIGEALDGNTAGLGVLPATFMLLAPASPHPDVWHDVQRMRTLNTEQARRNLTMHVCPLQYDIVDRLIERYSNPGDLVYDPFAGLGTVPLRALRAGRRGRGVELNPDYFTDSVRYLTAEEMRVTTPSLFDLIELEANELEDEVPA